jgi:hypothetical protein
MLENHTTGSIIDKNMQYKMIVLPDRKSLLEATKSLKLILQSRLLNV